MDAARDYYNDPNYTYSSFPNDSINDENVSEEISSRNTIYYSTEISSRNTIYYSTEKIIIDVVMSILILVICILGAVGNGIVIWLLGFRIKRNPFSTYILNLAIADFGVLLAATFFVVHYWVRIIHDTRIIFFVFLFPFLLMYSSSQFLLTAISVDRCVAIFFPLWHRGHRPLRLSTIVCALIWVLSFLLSAITFTFKLFFFNDRDIEAYCQYIVNALLCFPIMTIATGALFIKVCLKARQHRRGKVLTIVLLTLLFFLLFAFPLNVISILYVFTDLQDYLLHIAILLACLNSSVNPAIYILVGRQGKSRQRENMKMVFQKVFKEEESCTEEPPVETKL